METEAHVKLWLGNLDTKLTEYQLLKICEKFGEVSTFDFLYTITEGGKRYPRGYAFVTYTTAATAEAAIQALHGKKVLGRELVVRLANPRADHTRVASRPIPAALKAGGGTSLSEEQKAARIRALEAKLAGMEGGAREEFRVTAGPSTSQRKPYSR